MKKVGIVTFHHAHNYGAVLQCFALKVTLENLGYDVAVINHINKKVENAYALWPHFDYKRSIPIKFRSFVYRFLLNIRKQSRYKAFKKFIAEYLKVNLKSGENWSKFDAIVWGSDQIWNQDIINDDSIFWGDTGSSNDVRITYAASMGRIDRTILLKQLNLIKAFDSIGVREVSLQNALAEIGVDSHINLDPTLLLDRSQWEKYFSLKPTQPREYLLVYAMRNRERTLEAATKIAQHLNLPIVELCADVSLQTFFSKYSTLSPIDFVSMIQKASFVVTDSFHGTVFSIIFNIPFFTLRHAEGGNERAEHLTSILGLEDRMIPPSEIPSKISTIDFNKVESKLQILRKESINYLHDNLE